MRTTDAQVALKVLREIHGLPVMVVHPQDRDAEELVAHLRRIGCRVTAAWPPPNSLPANIQLIFQAIHLAGPEATMVNYAASANPPVVIGIVEYENPTILQKVIDTGAVAITTKPIRATGLLTTMVMALRLTSQAQDVAKRLNKLEAKISGLKRVERAKMILMDRNGVTEEEAYSSIREQAMTKRVGIEDIANAIINASEIIGTGRKRKKADN